MDELNLRRVRLNRQLRAAVREHRVHREQLIQPLFVVDGIAEREPIAGLDEVYRDTSDSILTQIDADLGCGIDKFLLFGVPRNKHPTQFDFEFACERIAAIKKQFGADIWLAVDVCLCSYTTHGHCGVLNAAGDYVVNDKTVTELAAAALQYAEAGADCVAPSDMMDGRISAIRNSLDVNQHDRVTLMSYAAKFHSSFYGPFRLAADSAPATNSTLEDRSTYQLDPARPTDALQCALRDDSEGADILMVKPGLPYLDVLAELSAAIPKPWAVYQTSGEQAAIDVLAKQDLIQRDNAQAETWIAFVRAGAQLIISYAARRANALLKY